MDPYSEHSKYNKVNDNTCDIKYRAQQVTNSNHKPYDKR